VLYNDHHNDYRTVKDDEPLLLDYLAPLVAKEYVLFNNPASTTTSSPKRWFAYSFECDATSHASADQTIAPLLPTRPV
jgi:hypothetical protein